MEKKPFLTEAMAQEIIQDVPTPFHVYDEKGIRENARRINKAFSWNKGFKEYFAVKALPNPVILQILKEEGYIESYQVAEPADGEVGKTLTITLKYGEDRTRSLAGLRRISKPGLRVYTKSNDLPKVLGGMGIAIISTSQGLMTDKQAHQKSVGGEVLAYVW